MIMNLELNGLKDIIQTINNLEEQSRYADSDVCLDFLVKTARNWNPSEEIVNFNEVAEAVYRDVIDLIINPEDFFYLITRFQHHFKHKSGKTVNIGLTLFEDRSIAMSFDYGRGDIVVNIPGIRYYAQLFGDKFDKNYFMTLLAHEAKHWIDYMHNTKTFGTQEKRKRKNWTQNIMGTLEAESPVFSKEDIYDSVNYYNHPHEVRARLAEVFHQLGLPQNKEMLLENIGHLDANKLTTLIKTNMTSPFAWKYMSNEAKNYMIVNLYKALSL